MLTVKANMPAISKSYAKNIIRRALRELVDPTPDKKEVQRVWDFFESRCAYCGAPLNRSKKEGHIDHVVSAAKDGPNHLSNRVLSCANCNEKEKRDSDWLAFLNIKASGMDFKLRKAKIDEWLSVNTLKKRANENLLAEADAAANEVVNLFDLKANEIVSARNHQANTNSHTA